MDNYILLITFVLFSHSTFSQVIIFIIPFTNRNYLYSKTQFLIQSLLLLLLLDIITILNSQNFYQFYYQILNYYLFITNYFTHFQTQTTLSRKIFPGILIPSYPSKFLPPLLKFHPYNDNDQRCSLPRLVNPGSSGPELARVENNERRNFDVPLAWCIVYGTKGLYVMYTEIKRGY